MKFIVTALFTLIASPAFASCLWGNPPVIVGIQQLTEDRAEVTIHNRLSVPQRGIETCELSFSGGIVVVEYHNERSTTPDSVFIYAPEGYAAIPPTLSIEEETVETVLIVPYIGS